MLDALRRVTALVICWPYPHLDGAAVRCLDLERWSASFDWRQDDWDGLRDVLQPVAETVATARGDCEDYAFAAASWALQHDRDGVGLAVCFEGWIRPRHVIAYDAERVYSSGSITAESVAEYVEGSRYRWALRRPLDPARFSPAGSECVSCPQTARLR